MKYKKYAGLVVMFAGVVLLSACTRSISQVDSQGKTNTPVFPDTSRAVRAEGSFVNIENLQKMRSGLTKNQVYELIGTPHFNEGVFRVKEWDYIFHFTRTDSSVLTCQYKVMFDADMQTQSFFFAPADCLNKLKPTATATPPVKTMYKELNAAGLFDFGSATLNNVGVTQINSLAAEMKNEHLNGKMVVVSGYTDRIGNQAQNKHLSLARAEAVKQLLAQNGIPSSMITTRGLGDSSPRVFCPGKKSPEIINCLAPNRRMTVDVIDTTSSR